MMQRQKQDLGDIYEEIRKRPITLLQAANVEATVAPSIKDAKVLSLACRNGHYSQRFLEFGAAKVSRLESSIAMIELANAAAVEDTAMVEDTAEADDAARTANKLRFQNVDCSTPVQREEWPFNIVFGVLLLDHTLNGKEMAEMFRNASLL